MKKILVIENDADILDILGIVFRDKLENPAKKW